MERAPRRFFDERTARRLAILALQGGALPGVLLRTRPFKSLADFRGLQNSSRPPSFSSVLRDLGADPVNMPMGDVYSALAKGVLDGVIAPVDTLKSLHFGDVAHFYTNLAVPRGAYPARAMGERRWASLSAENQRILEDSVAVWESALADQTRAAVLSGEAQGRHDRVQFFEIAPGEQAQFDALYERDAERNARLLHDQGIDALPVFQGARGNRRRHSRQRRELRRSKRIMSSPAPNEAIPPRLAIVSTARRPTALPLPSP